MQNVKDMKEIEPGVFIPTEKCFITDEEAWRNANRGYSCIRHRDTNELLFAFKKGTNGPKYADEHFDVPTYCIGGYSAVEPIFGSSQLYDWDSIDY